MANPMNLNLTVAGVTPGGTYTGNFYGPLIDANNQLTTDHDHTTGKGNPITSAALNINADVSWNGHAITNLAALGVTAITSDVSFTSHNLNSIGNASGNHFFSAYQYDVYNYGAVGNGSTDDRAALSNACTAVTGSTTGTGVVRLDVGVFRIGSNLTIPVGVTLQMNGGQLKPDSGVIITFLGNIDAPVTKIFSTTQSLSSDPAPIRFGAWTQTGQPSTQGPVYPHWWGAKGDNLVVGSLGAATDNTIPWQQCLNSFGYNPTSYSSASKKYAQGGTVLVPSGNYGFSAGLVLGDGHSGLTLQALGATAQQGIGGAELYFYQSDGSPGVVYKGNHVDSSFYSPVSWITMSGLQVVSWAAAGEAVLIKSASQCRFENCIFSTINTAKDVWYANGGSVDGNVDLVSVRDCTFVLNTSWAANAIRLDGGQAGVGQMGDVTFDTILINGGTTGTAYFIRVTCVDSTGVDTSNISFRNVRCELPVAGILHVQGASQGSFSQFDAGDLGVTAPIAPMFKFSSPLVGSGAPNNWLISEGFTDIGTNDTSTPTFQMATIANFSPPVIQNCFLPYIDTGLTAGTAGLVPLMIGGIWQNVTGQEPPMFIGSGGSNGFSGMSGAAGFSSTGVRSANVSGQLTVSSGSPTGTLTFPNAESDTNYRIVFTPVTNTSSVANSWVPKSVAKSNGSCILTLAATPDANITFDWHLFR